MGAGRDATRGRSPNTSFDALNAAFDKRRDAIKARAERNRRKRIMELAGAEARYLAAPAGLEKLFLPGCEPIPIDAALIVIGYVATIEVETMTEESTVLGLAMKKRITSRTLLTDAGKVFALKIFAEAVTNDAEKLSRTKRPME